MSVTIIHSCDYCQNETNDLPASGWVTAAYIRIASDKLILTSPQSTEGGTWCSWDCLSAWALSRGMAAPTNTAKPVMPGDELPF